MTRNLDREETFRIAAERLRLKKEKEAREEKEFYERVTKGTPWLIFKLVVIFCTAIAIITLIDTFVDGKTKKLSEKDWKIDHNWEWTWHQILDVEGYMFAPELGDWFDRKKNSLSITYSPILQTGKKIVYLKEVKGVSFGKHEDLRQNSFFNWFPFLQIGLLIPLATYIFKRQKPWFNFARVASMVVIFPGCLLVLYFTFF